MKALKGAITLLLCFILVFSFYFNSNATLIEEVSVNTHVQYQDFNGWGTSLAWWGNAIGLWDDTDKKNEVLDLIFDVNEGLGLNIVRYNIGGGENPDHEHMRDKAEIEGYQDINGNWDWSADASQRWVLQGAIDRGVNITEAFSNAPPYWMTKSQCAAGSRRGDNNLKDDYYDDFANYIAEVVEHFHNEWGVTFDTVTPVNEPSSAWWKSSNNQEGCHFDPDKQNMLMTELKNQLTQRGLNIPLSGPEEYSIDTSLSTYYFYDDQVKDSMHQINTHTYSGNKRRGLLGASLAEGKELWVSEVGAGGTADHNHNDLTSALDLAEKITKDMREMQPNAWVYWQVVEDEAGNHNWGLIHANFSGEEEYFVTKQYYAMANYSKFISKGSYILNNTSENMVTAYDPQAKKLTVVVKNQESTVKEYNVNLTGFNQTGNQAKVYRTSGTEDLQQLDSVNVEDEVLEIESLGNSVTTYVINDVELSNNVKYSRDSYYKIVNKKSDKVLEVSGESVDEGANVIQWEDNNAEHQQWRLVEVDEGEYFIVNRKSKKVLDIMSESTDNGATAIQWLCAGGDNQLWKLEEIGNGLVKIISVGSDKALDVLDGSTDNGGDVIQWEYWGGDNQQWQIIQVDN